MMQNRFKIEANGKMESQIITKKRECKQNAKKNKSLSSKTIIKVKQQDIVLNIGSLSQPYLEDVVTEESPTN